MKNKTSKTEARLKRKLEKLSKENTKKVRLSNNIEIKDKYIRSSEVPELTKTPRSKSPENYKNYFFCWSDNHSDTEGCWSWKIPGLISGAEPRKWSDEEYAKKIKPHMDSHINDSWPRVENKTYNAKKGKRKLLNKYQSIDSICGEAQNRWFALGLSEFEELFRMRLGTNKRIWGFRIQHFFFLVWYERDHNICPIDHN